MPSWRGKASRWPRPTWASGSSSCAGKGRSHMVMPAIHLSEGEWPDLLPEVTGSSRPDIPALVAVARRELRQKFLAADMGITGANVAVAETGTLVVVTNEGNARLVSTLPRIQVAVVGVEKLVERFSDVGPILKALPRSATGQLITSLRLLFTGARRRHPRGSRRNCTSSCSINGRTGWRRDPRFAQALRCIRCASCVNVCPVYRLLGGHVFGGVYTGGIGAILAAWFDDGRSKPRRTSSRSASSAAPAPPSARRASTSRSSSWTLRRRLAQEEGLPLKNKRRA